MNLLKSLINCILVTLMLFGNFFAWAAQGEDQLKASFVYRFMQYTQWPPPPLHEFTYCVAGTLSMQTAMEEMTRRSRAGSGTLADSHIKLLNVKDPQQAFKCQLLVLNINDRTELQRWQNVLIDAPVLIVGDNAEAFRAGVVIALVIEPNGMSFRINHTEAKRRGLILSSQMLKLAREVK